MKKGKKILGNLLKFLLFLSIGIAIFYLVYRNQSAAYLAQCAQDGIPAEECSLIDKVVTDFRNANYFWILMVLLAFLLSNVSRAIRWNMLLRPLGYRPRFVNAFFTIILGYFANLGIPRIGEVARATTMAQYELIPVQKVMGTVVVDRVVDVLSILLITGLAILLEFDTILQFVNEQISLEERLGGLPNLLLWAGLLALVGVLLVWGFRRRLAQTALYQKIVHIVYGFWQGIQTIARLERPGVFILHSINIWFMYFLMTYLCFFAFAPTAHLSPMVALIVFVFGAWGIVVPAPGGMGTYHFMTQTALMMYGVSGEDGFSWANIAFFSIQLGVNIFVGIIALISLPLINRYYQPEASELVADG
jgi:uncharacterized protein (TIRG00374 family)